MKKICFVTTVSITIKAFLLQFIDYLVNEGYDVTFICNTDESMYKLCNDYIHYIPVPMKRGVGFDGLSVINKLTKIFKENNFDIIQYSTPNASLYASIAAKRAGCENRLYCQWGIRYMGFEGGIKRMIFKQIEKIVCQKSSVIECESHSIYNFSINEKLYPASKGSVIWNGSACGVDFNKFDLSKKLFWREEKRTQYNFLDEDIVFAFAARLTADKGVNELLEAFLDIEKNYPNVKLLMMGGMDNNKSLKQELMAEAEKSKNIIFTGNVPNVEEYYAASDVFVAPSYREGFGLVVIEAEAMGLPAIVSNVPGQVDAIEENETGLTCTVRDSKSLENAMIKLIDGADLRIDLGKKASKYVEDNYDQNKLFGYLKKHRDALISGDK